jgi:aryl-alcohol dehydrogenase-like predicted oxidoreductase
MQNHYNLLYREEEREMVPTLKVKHSGPFFPVYALALNGRSLFQHFGVGSIPWSPLARGALTRPLGERTIRTDDDQWEMFIHCNRKDLSHATSLAYSTRTSKSPVTRK